MKLTKLEDMYFNISSLILRWEPSKKIENFFFNSVYVGGVYEVWSWTVVHREDLGVHCEICLNKEMFVIMAVRECDLHTNIENIPTKSIFDLINCGQALAVSAHKIHYT